jgi:DNA primase
MADVLDVLAELQITVSNAGGKEISAHCPFHTDSHPSFSINADSGLWICYQCGESGTLNMLVEKIGGTIDVKAFLRESKAKKVKKKDPPKEESVPEPVLDFDIIQVRYENFGPPPKWALKKRMISQAAAEQYGLKWDKGWVVPIIAPDTEDLWGWQWKREEVVYNFPTTVKKSLTLFGLDWIGTGHVALVESPLDVVRLASVGVTAVSSYGAMVSNVQLELLVDYADKVILALDADEEGERQSEKIHKHLVRRITTTTAKFPAGIKDPGDMDDQTVERVFGNDLQRHASAISGGRHRHDARSRLSSSRPRDGAR